MATPTNAKGISLSLKGVVDEDKKKVIFVESDDEFVDVLLSFLTMPLGTIIRLARDKSMQVGMGCMNNLYESVKNLDLQYFHFESEAGKLMFLSPRSEAESHRAHLKLKIDNAEPETFLCGPPNSNSGYHSCWLYSHYKDVLCKCGRPMGWAKKLGSPSALGKREGVFVNGMTRFMISDELRVVQMSSLESFSLLANHSNIREKTFNIGEDEVLNLLICTLQTRTPLTEVLAKSKCASDLRSSSTVFRGGSCMEPCKEEDLPDKDGKICLKLMISKSKNIVCYAEATKDFVNFLLSFLTVPLGCIAKELRGEDLSSGCIDQLYQSVQDLDDQFFKSSNHKEMLVSPSLAFGFSYKNDLLGIKTASMPQYPSYHTSYLGLDPKNHYPSSYLGLDPKNHYVAVGKTDKGIIAGTTTMFVVTNNLTVAPISSILCMSILKELKVCFSDIEERTLNIGKKEARRLLVSSFISESALTDAFIADPKQKKTK